MPSACQSKTLLLLDGHSSHVKNFDVITKAHENNINNIIILSLPSQCTHRIQSLDVAFFNSLKAHYNAVVQTWLRHHPRRPITESEFKLFNSAHTQLASVDMTLNGLRKTGIYPFNRDAFTDKYFLASTATERR